MTPFEELMAFQRETEALSQVMGRLGWDQETVMPEGASEQRAEEIAALDGVIHARRTDPRIGEWLEAARAEDEASARQLELIGRRYRRTKKVPAKLSAALARATSLGHRVWAEARADDDFARFAPTLDDILRLVREKADALADGGDAYDALLDDYEPGATGDELSVMFNALRPRLVALRDRILGSDKTLPAIDRDFHAEGQLVISRDLALAFGYDLSMGRIDMAVHPFSSGSGLDVRITTRTDPLRPFDCFYSTVHEVGHAAYEQGIDRAFLLTPLGRGVSMGVHESQSRIYENQLGRSPAFAGWLHGRMAEIFGDLGVGPGEFARVVNRVEPGYIRTEADEVHYNLHVSLRFDIERDLIAGRLAVADLPEAWNARFEQDFGVKVDRPSNGVLQDVHWSEGLFGYFPTYTLGNLYAGCLWEALVREVPDVEASLATGDTRPATAWLRDKVQRHGGLYRPKEVIRRATGAEPTEEPLLSYLEAKFGALYGL
jgi:carboxypeptidase Taq